MEIFPFSFDEVVSYQRDESGVVYGRNEIQCWSKNQEGQTCLVRIFDYPVTCELQLPTTANYREIKWDKNKIDRFITAYKNFLRKNIDDYNLKFVTDENGRDEKVMPYLVYYHYYEAKEFYYYQTELKPFIRLYFRTREDMYAFIQPLKDNKSKDKFYKKTLPFEELMDIFNSKQKVWLSLAAWETQIHSTKKLLTDIYGAFTGWYKLESFYNSHDYTKDKYPEYQVSYKYLKFIPEKKEIPKIRFMSFDIETFCDKEGEFPNEANSDHVVYMISCVSEETGSPDDRKRTILTYGECPLAEKRNDVICINTENEEELIQKFIDYIEEDDPDLITGYNTLGFDWKYLQMRARKNIHPWDNPWARCSRLKERYSERVRCVHKKFTFECENCSRAPFKVKDMNSSGRGENKFQGVEIKGRMSMVDMCVIVKTDYKSSLALFNLGYVSQHFLKEGKREVTANEMFRIFQRLLDTKEVLDKDANYPKRIREENRVNYEIAKSEYARVADYCVQDSELVNKLMVNLNSWIWLCNQAAIYGVNPENVYLYGQSKRGISLFYEEAHRSGFVMTERPKVTYNYKGGYVSEPRRGIHRTFCVDYNSLYPNTGRRYNIDFTTILTRLQTIQIALNFAKIRNIDFKIPSECEECEKLRSVNENILCRKHEDELVIKLIKSKEEFGELQHDALEIALWDEEIEIDKTPKTADEYDENGKKKKKKNKKVVVMEKRFNIFMFRKPYEVDINGEKKIIRGIFPKLAANLIGKRKEVKGKQKKYPSDSIEWIMLEQEQLTLKMATNSLYGFLGRNVGQFTFPEGAMSITFWGRDNIIKTGKHLSEKYKDEGAQVVYGDTDSVMLEVLKLKGSNGDDLHDRAIFMSRQKEFEDAANEINIDPMHVEYEKGMHGFFLQKKMYGYYKMKSNGEFEMEEYSKKDENGKVIFYPKYREKGYFKGRHLPHLNVKGIPLAKRTDCFATLDMYEAIFRSPLDGVPKDKMKDIMIQIILNLMTMQVPAEDLAVVSSVSSHYADEGNQLKIFSDHRASIGRPVIGGERYSLIYCVPKDINQRSDKIRKGLKLRGFDEYEDNRGTERAERIDYLYYVEKMKRSDECYYLPFHEEIDKKMKEEEEKEDRDYWRAYAISVILVLANRYTPILDYAPYIDTDPRKVIEHALTVRGCKTVVERIKTLLNKRKKIRDDYRLKETDKPIIQIYKGLLKKEEINTNINNLKRNEYDVVDVKEMEKVRFPKDLHFSVYEKDGKVVKSNYLFWNDMFIKK